MEIELISFDRCPFVQRSVITLLYKEAPFEITYIDLADKPDWFLEISPLGRVPALRVRENGNETALFESAVINEFVDEVTPGQLHPEDPVRRAVNRAWIEFGGALFTDNYKMSVAETEEEFATHREELAEHMQRLEDVLGGGPFFNGEAFSWVDAAYAPFFMRTELWRGRVEFYDRARFPKAAAWGDQMLALEAVQQSVVPDFTERVFASARKSGKFVGSRLAA